MLFQISFSGYLVLFLSNSSSTFTWTANLLVSRLHRTKYFFLVFMILIYSLVYLYICEISPASWGWIKFFWVIRAPQDHSTSERGRGVRIQTPNLMFIFHSMCAFKKNFIISFRMTFSSSKFSPSTDSFTRVFAVCGAGQLFQTPKKGRVGLASQISPG